MFDVGRVQAELQVATNERNTLKKRLQEEEETKSSIKGKKIKQFYKENDSNIIKNVVQRT